MDYISESDEFRTNKDDYKHLRQQATKKKKSELKVRVPTHYSDGRDYPALVVFHARYGERPEISAEEWLPVASTGTILAAPWSSQMYASDGRCWDDPEVSERDVKWTFEQLGARYRLNPERLVLGGFSQGGALSIYSALKRVVSCRGVVAGCPSGWGRA